MERVAVVGGSGFYAMEGVEITKEVFPTTPYGNPSNEILLGHYGETPVAFLPRHGRGHRFNPSSDVLFNSTRCNRHHTEEIL